MKQLIQMVNNKPMTTSLVVAEQFERRHDHVLRTIDSLIEDGTIGALEFGVTSYTDKSNRQSKMYELTERGFLIAMPFIGGRKAKQGQAKLVDAFLTMRRQSEPEPNLSIVMPEIQIAESAARMLRMSESSKVRMLSSICEEKGISTGFLPAYVEEDLTKALGDLLKDNGCELSARAVNQILVVMGFLEERERRSSGGSIKKFKCITQAGLQFGKNDVHPRSPNETQPRYYVKTFPRLLDVVYDWMSSEDKAA